MKRGKPLLVFFPLLALFVSACQPAQPVQVIEKSPLPQETQPPATRTALPILTTAPEITATPVAPTAAASNQAMTQEAVNVDDITITTAHYQPHYLRWTISGTCNTPFLSDGVTPTTITILFGPSIEGGPPVIGTATCIPGNQGGSWGFGGTSDAPAPDPDEFNYVSAESALQGFYQSFPVSFAGKDNPSVATDNIVADAETEEALSEFPPTPELDELDNFMIEFTQLYAPDETFVARVLTAFPDPSAENSFGHYYARVWILNLSTSEINLIKENWDIMALGLTTPELLGWTKDNTSLFIGEVGVPDGCGNQFTRDVQRYDLESKSLTSLGLSNRGPLSISPDGSQALILEPGIVRRVDLGTMAESQFPFEAPQDEYWLRDPVWSPDGQKVLFRLALNPCGPPDGMASWIFLFDLSTGDSQVLLRDDPGNFSPVSWPLNDLAQMRNWDQVRIRDGETAWLDLSSGEMSSEPPVEVAGAISALVNFFAALSDGRYADAERYYGGSYEILNEMNPSVDPQDRIALLESGCTVNGFACLPVYRVTLIGQPDAKTYEFLVVFDQDGSAFQRGPCCGASIEEIPPETEFKYLVQGSQEGSWWRVKDLPVYVP